MAGHRNNLHQARLTSIFVEHEFDESNEAVFEVRTDENAAIHESCIHLTNGFKVFSIVPEWLPLAGGGLVIDGVYALDIIVVKGYLPDCYAIFCSFSNFISYLKVDLLSHPVIKSRNGQGRHVVPFHWVVEFRRTFREPLDKGEKIDAGPRTSQRPERRLRVLEKLVSFSIDKTNSDQGSIDPHFLAANVHEALPFFTATIR